jgi:hypothetical protein
MNNDELLPFPAHTPKVAGIRGGVGASAIATIIGADDVGQHIGAANVIVARNDYRCAQALVEEGDAVLNKTVVVFCEPGRALGEVDFRALFSPNVITWVFVPWSESVARADDAGLLQWGGTADIRQIKTKMRFALPVPA